MNWRCLMDMVCALITRAEVRQIISTMARITNSSLRPNNAIKTMMNGRNGIP